MERLIIKKNLKLLLYSVLIPTSIWAGGANGKNFGSIYSQLTYSPISTDTYFDQNSELQEGLSFTRQQIENYGEIGVYGSTTTLVWNLSFAQQKLGQNSSAQGIGPTMIGLQYQYYNSTHLKLGAGLSSILPSPQNTSQTPLSDNDTHYNAAHFLQWSTYQANVSYLSDLESHSMQFDVKKTWNPISALYLSAAMRGQRILSATTEESKNKGAILIGHSLQTEYYAPGIEVFYSFNSNWHTVASFYGGFGMKDIFAAPGVKVGLAWTI